jgi:hypothetical protein
LKPGTVQGIRLRRKDDHHAISQALVDDTAKAAYDLIDLPEIQIKLGDNVLGRPALATGRKAYNISEEHSGFRTDPSQAGLHLGVFDNAIHQVNGQISGNFSINQQCPSQRLALIPQITKVAIGLLEQIIETFHILAASSSAFPVSSPPFDTKPDHSS